MIQLMNVNGINRVDTPFFDTETSQDGYFRDKVIWTDDSAYYPPFYHNKMRVSVEDFIISDTDKPINYCRISYAPLGKNPKWYYYFIDDVRYITDGVLELDLAMDTIQTYLFDIGVTEAFVSRKSIRRWTEDGLINRDYIRENLSQAEQEKTYQKPLASPFGNLGWIVILASDDLGVTRPPIARPEGVGIHGDGQFRYMDSDVIVPSTGGSIFLIPLLDGKIANGVKLHLDTDYTLSDGHTPAIVKLAADSRVTNIFYLPFNPFFAISYVPATNTIRVGRKTIDGVSGTFFNFYPCGFNEGQYSFIELNFPSSIVPGKAISGNATIIDLSKQTLGLPEGFALRKNEKKKVSFDPMFVPALLDENYIIEEYSFNGASVVLPWHLIDHPSNVSIACVASPYGDISLFVDGQFGDFEYKANSFGSASVSSLPQFDLYTDVWKNYQVNHQGSMITDWVGLGLHGSGQLVTRGGFMASRAEYGARFEQRSALQAMRYQGRTEAYITGFDTLAKSIDETRNSIEDMALGIDSATKGRR